MIRSVSRYAPLMAKKGIRLPRYLLNSPGSQYEAFESDADWTLYTGGSKASNTAEVYEGSASEKLTTREGAETSIRKTVAWDLSAAERFGVWIYVHDTEAEYHATDGCSIFLQTSATLVDYYKFKFQGTYMDSPGWHYFAMPLSRALSYGAPSWASIIRLMFQGLPVAGQVVSLSFDDFWSSQAGVPAIMFFFDDGYASQYSVAFAHMKLHKLRGTLACQTDLVGDAGYVTAAQLQEMHGEGWAMANHTGAGTALGGQAEAAQLAQVQAGIDALEGWGLAKNSKYLVYPSGTWDTATLSVMEQTGTLVGRGVQPTTVRPLMMPVSHLYKIECTSIDAAVSLATAQGYVDQAIAEKSILSILFHGIVGGTEWDQTTFDDFIDYVAPLAAAGSIHAITIDDFYKLTKRAIRIPEAIA